jgi:hypothetical protein
MAPRKATGYSPPPMCMAKYDRAKAVGEARFQPLYCQYVFNHDGEHSWESMSLLDFVNREQAHPLPTPETPSYEVGKLVGQIDLGHWDPYIELLLTALHDRKRALRGVRGFPRQAS